MDLKSSSLLVQETRLDYDEPYHSPQVPHAGRVTRFKTHLRVLLQSYFPWIHESRPDDVHGLIEILRKKASVRECSTKSLQMS